MLRFRDRPPAPHGSPDIDRSGAFRFGARIKLDVVQVQQWLTDISATRGRDGLDDGFDVAAEFAADFHAATAELEALRPELGPQLDELEAVFADYHAAGIAMAEAYIEGGPASGNPMMGEFDAAAAAMGETADALVDELLAGAAASLDSAGDSARQVQTVALTAALVIAALGILLGAVLVRRISRLLSRLADSALGLARGNADLDLDDFGSDEVGELARSLGTAAEAVAARMALEAEKEESSAALVRLFGEVEAVARDLSERAELLTAASSETLEATGTSTQRMSAAVADAGDAAEAIAHSAQRAAELSSRALD
jgi:methyl-accepting chemotaxis protein